MCLKVEIQFQYETIGRLELEPNDFLEEEGGK